MNEEEKKALEEFRSKPPEEAAGEIYSRLIKPFDFQIRGLSKKGLYRVLQALIKVPVIEFYFKLDKREEAVYHLANRLMEAKFIMVAKVLEEQFKEAKKLERKAKKEHDKVSQNGKDSNQEG